jgi:hypothetical protein
MTVGKLCLLGASQWHGILNMNDNAAMERLKAYTFR